LAKSSMDTLAKIEAAKKAEDEKKKQEEQKSAKQKAREIVRVSKIYPSKPNSADGVDLYVHWTNMSDNTIKYIYFSAVPINAVGDVVSSDIGGATTYTGQHTGPVTARESFGSEYVWENAWYNNTIRTVKLQKVEIIYMDGSTVTLEDDDVAYIQY